MSIKNFYISGIEFIVIHKGVVEYQPVNQQNMVVEQLDSFAIAKYPISNSQFLKFLDNNLSFKSERMKNSNFLRDYRKLNVINKKKMENAATYFVDWNDANAFCEYLSTFLNMTDMPSFRLPTEAEWYYVATCGKNTDFISKDDRIVCMNNRGPMRNVELNTNLYVNDFGVAGMLGNINEWTSSSTEITKVKKFESAYSVSQQRMVIKGGSFASRPTLISPNYATDVDVTNLHYIGFRPTITLNPILLEYIQKEQSISQTIQDKTNDLINNDYDEEKSEIVEEISEDEVNDFLDDIF